MSHDSCAQIIDSQNRESRKCFRLVSCRFHRGVSGLVCLCGRNFVEFKVCCVSCLCLYKSVCVIVICERRRGGYI